MAAKILPFVGQSLFGWNQWHGTFISRFCDLFWLSCWAQMCMLHCKQNFCAQRQSHCHQLQLHILGLCSTVELLSDLHRHRTLAVQIFFVTHLYCSDLFDAGREVCDDFEDVVCFSEILTDVGFLCTNHPDGQTRTWRQKGVVVFRKYRSYVIE